LQKDPLKRIEGAQNRTAALSAINTFQLMRVNKQLSGLGRELQSINSYSEQIASIFGEQIEIAKREELFRVRGRVVKHCIFEIRQALIEIPAQSDTTAQLIMVGELRSAMSMHDLNPEYLEEVAEKELLQVTLQELKEAWVTRWKAASKADRADLQEYYDLESTRDPLAKKKTLLASHQCLLNKRKKTLQAQLAKAKSDSTITASFSAIATGAVLAVAVSVWALLWWLTHDYDPYLDEMNFTLTGFWRWIAILFVITCGSASIIWIFRTGPGFIGTYNSEQTVKETNRMEREVSEVTSNMVVLDTAFRDHQKDLELFDEEIGQWNQSRSSLTSRRSALKKWMTELPTP
jgi:hypothetical protein